MAKPTAQRAEDAIWVRIARRAIPGNAPGPRRAPRTERHRLRQRPRNRRHVASRRSDRMNALAGELAENITRARKRLGTQAKLDGSATAARIPRRMRNDVERTTEPPRVQRRVARTTSPRRFD